MATKRRGPLKMRYREFVKEISTMQRMLRSSGGMTYISIDKFESSCVIRVTRTMFEPGLHLMADKDKCKWSTCYPNNGAAISGKGSYITALNRIKVLLGFFRLLEASDDELSRLLDGLYGI